MTYTIPRPPHGPEHGPDHGAAGPSTDDTRAIALRAAQLSAELARLFDRLAAAAVYDARVRQARHRLEDASYSCRRAGEELDAVSRHPGTAGDRSA